jgi:hypothetical protein
LIFFAPLGDGVNEENQLESVGLTLNLNNPPMTFKISPEELNMDLDESIDNEFFRPIYKTNSGCHTR